MNRVHTATGPDLDTLRDRPPGRRGALGGSTSVIALVLLLMAAVSAPATVADTAYLSIEAVPPVPGAQHWTLYLDGEFDRGATARLAGLIAQQGISQASVYLNSPGGSLIAGMGIGRLLREHRFQTHVGKRTADERQPAIGVCYSACPFAYAGGVVRFLEEGSVLGIHRAMNRVPVANEVAFEQLLSGEATSFLTAMGVDSRMFAMMARIPPNGIRLLTREEAVQLNLVNSSVTIGGGHFNRTRWRRAPAGSSPSRRRQS